MPRRGENIYKRKDGRWEGRYKNGIKPDGKTKYSSVYGKTYKEVRSILNKKKSQNHEISVSSNISFGELADVWMKNIRITIKESTYVNYITKLRKHIYPIFKNIRYDSLTAEKLNNFISEKIASGLSMKYTADIAGIIKSICRFAKKKYKYTDKSEFMIIPKSKEIKCFQLLSEENQKILNTYLINSNSSSDLGILLSSVTGLRIGELCALKWSDIDLKKRIITVNSTVQRIKNLEGKTATKIIITSPKSKTSFRKIPIPNFILPLLNKFSSEPQNYVLSNNSSITEPRTMQYRFKNLLKKVGLPHMNFHALRHTFATNAVKVGFDIKTLSEILGHSSVEITLNRYVHSSFERKRICMDMMSEVFI